MKTKAAVLLEHGKPFEILELDLDGPAPGEVLVNFKAAGMCHTDLHLTDGHMPPRFPIVGGHEGAGIIEEVGVGVTKVKPGDHIVCTPQPSCGICRNCSTGKTYLCVMGATIQDGCMPDRTFRFHKDGKDFGAFSMLGTFSERATVSQHSVIKIDEWLPLDTACVVGCGVPTGWGSAVYDAEVRAGDIVIIYGIGGLGINAVQGAVHSGAKYVLAVDPIEFKRESALSMGATHVFADAETAQQKLTELSWGEGADSAIVVVDIMHEKVVQDAVAAVGRGGRVVLTGLAGPEHLTVHVSGFDLSMNNKTIRGTLLGSCNMQYDVPRLLRLFDAGQLKLKELITRTYDLEDINQGYDDLKAGKNIRGVIIH